MIGGPAHWPDRVLERRVAVDRLLLERVRQDVLQREVVAQLVVKHAATAAQRQRPLPKMSHANPTRGCMLFLSGK